MKMNGTNSPTFVLTADQDWAPEWACEYFVKLLSDNRLIAHVFRTSRSEALDYAVDTGLITNGWHPNFKRGSSHGLDIAEVIDTMMELFPGCTTVRAHSYFESSETWKMLKHAGITVESHGPTDMEENLMPLRMMSGLTRLPVYLEDDVHLIGESRQKSLKRFIRNIGVPGLKILDFHPIHLALNTPSLEHYDEFKRDPQGMSDTHGQSGVRDAFLEIVQIMRLSGLEFSPILKLI